jgi:hypothetical protein
MFVCVCVCVTVAKGWDETSWCWAGRVGTELSQHPSYMRSAVQRTHVRQAELGAHRKLAPFLRAPKEGTGRAFVSGGGGAGFL